MPDENALLGLQKYMEEPTPRSIPNEVIEGNLYTSRKSNLILCLIIGCAMIAFSYVPFVKSIALYFLPLDYLIWIGSAIILLSFIHFIRAEKLKAALKYLREGELGEGKVLDIIKTPTLTHYGETTQFIFIAKVEFEHPKDREPAIFEISSPDIVGGSMNETNTRFLIGDVVPIVWFKEEFDTTVQLLDFLSVYPPYEIKRKEKKANNSILGYLQLVLFLGIIVIIVGFYGVLKFMPMEFDFWGDGKWFFASGVFLWFLVVIGIVLSDRKQRREFIERNRLAEERGEAVEIPSSGMGWLLKIIMALGFLLFSNISVFGFAFWINAKFDKSTPRTVKVDVTDMIQVTRKLVFREYTIKYKHPESETEQEISSEPNHMYLFDSYQGVAITREGALGWKWVEAVNPRN